MTIQHCPTQKAPDRPSSTHWEHSITTKTFARTKKRHIYRLVKKAKPDTYTRTWTRMQYQSSMSMCIWEHSHRQMIWLSKWAMGSKTSVSLCVNKCVCVRFWTGKLGVKLWWRLWLIFISTLTVVLTHTHYYTFVLRQQVGEREKFVCVCVCCLNVSGSTK